MQCSTFRDNHAAFIDDVLGPGELVAMQYHLIDCPSCAHHDTTVRRALLLFRNLPTIEPSADFSARLHARLRAAARGRGRFIGGRLVDRKVSGLGAFAAAAAVVIAAGYLTVSTASPTAPIQELALTPVVASAPEPQREFVRAVRAAVDDDDAIASPLAGPTIVASVSAGMPMWPAAFLAQQAPVHFAASAFKLVDLHP